MADRLDELSTIDYKANVTFKLNQTPGKLYPLVGSTGSYSESKSQIEDRFDDLYLEDKTTRNGDTNNTELGSVRRWVNKPPSANVAPMKDRDDSMVTRVDLDSPLVKQTAVATKRYHDDMWLAGYFGTAYTGEHGDVAVAFDSSNVVAHGGVGLTYAKLLEAVELLALNDVDMEAEAPIMLLTPQQRTDLFNIAEYKSADFLPGYPIARGEVKSMLGIRFIVVNLGSAAAYNRERDVAAIRYKAAGDARNYRADATNKRKAAKNAIIGSLFSAASGAIKGASAMSSGKASSDVAAKERNYMLGGSIRLTQRAASSKTMNSGKGGY